MAPNVITRLHEECSKLQNEAIFNVSQSRKWWGGCHSNEGALKLSFGICNREPMVVPRWSHTDAKSQFLSKNSILMKSTPTFNLNFPAKNGIIEKLIFWTKIWNFATVWTVGRAATYGQCWQTVRVNWTCRNFQVHFMTFLFQKWQMNNNKQ